MHQQLTSFPRPARPLAGPARARSRSRPAAVLAASLALAAPDAGAQTVLGAAPSAFVLPRGVVRVGVAQSWTNYDETFGVPGVPGDTSNVRVALGARLSSDALGAREFTLLAPVERDLRQLAGQEGLALSLGRTMVSATASSRTTAIDLEAGLGAGLSFGVVVPIVRTLASVGVLTNAPGGDANVGLNPARYATDAQGVASQNALVKQQFDLAATRLRQQYGSCFTAAGGSTGAAGCADVVAFHTAATTYASTLARVYGTAAQSGAPVVPIAGSAAQRGVEATVASYSARFAALLGTAGPGPITADVQGALPVTEANLQTLLTDAGAGLGQDSLRSVSRLTLGDVEIGLRLRLLDTFGGREPRRLVPRGVNLRSTVAGVIRLGTGHVDSPNDLIDVATGDGQNDVEVASLTDVIFGSRTWLSLVARYGRQLADEQPLRIPFAGAGAYLPAFTLQTVGRDLGDYVQVEATPRYAISSAFAVEAQYRFRRKQADVYTGSFVLRDSVAGSAGLELDAAALSANSEQREQRVGVAATYSTYAAHARRRARVPLELSLGYQRTIAGRGGVPAARVAHLQLRAFPRLFGPDWRAPLGAR